MIYEIKNEQGEWIEGVPTVHLEPYRLYFSNDFYIESFWSDPALEETQE